MLIPSLLIFFSCVAWIHADDTCAGEWEKIMNSTFDSSLPSDYSKMFKYSGIAINNLGNFESCNNLDAGKYILFVYNKIPLIVQTFCGPKICQIKDYSNSFPLAISEPLFIIPVKEYQQKHYGEYSSGAILMIIFITFIFIIGIIATYCDIFFKEDQKSHKIIGCLLCFSIASNWKKLIASRSLENNDFAFLDGVRGLSIIWIILCHVVYIYIEDTALTTYDTILNFITDFFNALNIPSNFIW